MPADFSLPLYPQILLRNVQVVPVGGVPAPDGAVDVRMQGGRIVGLAPSLAADASDEDVHDGEGRWAIPGLWDHHVHLAQWADTLARVDMTGTRSAEEVLARVRAHLDELPGSDRDSVVIGFGHRAPSRPGQR